MHLTDYTRLVDNNQGPGEVFMRYPLGRIGLWSTPEGEIADSVTRGLMLYPTVDQVVDKGTANWRASISASPSRTDITYAAERRRPGLPVALTVTPDVSVYQYHFRDVTSYAAVDLLMREVENSNVTWSASTFRYLGRQAAEVTLSDGGGQVAYFYVGFSRPASGHGTFTSRGTARGATSVTGDNMGGYLTFAPGRPVTVAVAVSMTSMARARAEPHQRIPRLRLRPCGPEPQAGVERQARPGRRAERQHARGQGDLHRPVHALREHHRRHRQPVRIPAGAAEPEAAHHRLVHLVGAGGRRLLPVLIRSEPERLRVPGAARSVRHDRHAQHVPVAVPP